MNTTIHFYHYYSSTFGVNLSDILLISLLVPNLISFFGLVTTPIFLAVNNNFQQQQLSDSHDSEREEEDDEREEDDESEEEDDERDNEVEEEERDNEVEEKRVDEENTSEESSDEDESYIPKIAQKSFINFANDFLSYINHKSKDIEKVISNSEFKKYNTELLAESKKMINMVLENSSYEDILKTQGNIQSLVKSVGKFINDIKSPEQTSTSSTSGEQTTSTTPGEQKTSSLQGLEQDPLGLLSTSETTSESSDVESKQNMRYGN
jgi:hypothetical protein